MATRRIKIWLPQNGDLTYHMVSTQQTIQQRHSSIQHGENTASKNIDIPTWYHFFLNATQNKQRNLISSTNRRFLHHGPNRQKKKTRFSRNTQVQNFRLYKNEFYSTNQFSTHELSLRNFYPQIGYFNQCLLSFKYGYYRRIQKMDFLNKQTNFFLQIFTRKSGISINVSYPSNMWYYRRKTQTKWWDFFTPLKRY